jgi:hypothetical protein
MSKYALAFLASDNYFHWTLSFLESVRSKTGKLPLYCIPHHGLMKKIADLRRAFDFEILQEELDRLDAFAQRLYPRHARYRANLRKYSALSLPVDEVAYFDVDVVMLADPTRLFGHIRPKHVDLLYLATSPDWVYARTRIPLARSLFPEMRLISAGAFVTSPAVLNIDELIRTVETHLELFRSLRRARVYDQPVLNFVLHLLGKRCRHIAELDCGLAGIASAVNPNIAVVEDKVIDSTVSGDLMAIHWAGNARSWQFLANPRSWPLYAFRNGVRSRALQRLKALSRRPSLTDLGPFLGDRAIVDHHGDGVHHPHENQP